MSNIQFVSSTTDEGTQTLTVVILDPPVRILPPVDDTHPNFEAIKSACLASLNGIPVDTDDLASLFDIAQTIATRFEAISDRIKSGHGRILFDGEQVDNSLTKQILRFQDEGVEDWKPLVKFMENVQDNPNEHSRTQLYDWLDTHAFTITSEGMIVGYKGVQGDGAGGFKSISSGSEDVLVDGVVHRGQIPNPIGATIEMARSLVQHDPSVGCHRGLHVGTYEYASSFSYGTVLEVHVNPRDVVSVPTDCNWQKVRCCRYTVVDVLEAKYDTAVVGLDVDNSGDDDDHYLDIDLTVDPDEETPFYGDLHVGDRVHDWDGDLATVIEADEDIVKIKYDDSIYGTTVLDADDFESGEITLTKVEDDEEDESLPGGFVVGDRVRHGCAPSAGIGTVVGLNTTGGGDINVAWDGLDGEVCPANNSNLVKVQWVEGENNVTFEGEPRTARLFTDGSVYLNPTTSFPTNGKPFGSIEDAEETGVKLR